MRVARHPLALLMLLSVSFMAACGGPPANEPRKLKPVDERRAMEIIAEVFRDKQHDVVARRTLQLVDEKTLEVDVGAADRKFGVAYVTHSERRALGNALPAPLGGDALQIILGEGDDSEARVLLLFEENYVSDDNVGTDRSVSTVTAELKLERDVRDFVLKAQSEKWP